MAVYQKNKVSYIFPGLLFSNTDSKDIEEWDTDKAVEMADKDAYAFRFVRLIVSDPIPDGQGGFLEVMPKKIKESAIYFLGGELFGHEELNKMAEREPEAYRILRDNIVGNNYTHAVHCRTGNWVGFRKGDILIGTEERK